MDAPPAHSHHDLLVVHRDLDHGVDDDSRIAQRFGLGNGARESVEHEALRTVGAVEALSYHRDDEVVRDERARIHDPLGLSSERGSFAHRRPEHVSARDLGNAEVSGEKAGLRAFARARAAE